MRWLPGGKSCASLRAGPGGARRCPVGNIIFSGGTLSRTSGASPEARLLYYCRRAALELPRLFAIVPQNPLGDQGGLGLVLHIDADDPGQLHRFADFVP